MIEEDKEYDLIVLNTRELLKLSHFKEFVWHVLSTAGIYNDVFTGDNSTYYLQGKQAVGLELLQLLEDADPTAYARMLLEKQKLKDGKK